TVACAAGFTLTSATVNCPPDATQGQATTGGTCAENSCAAYDFPPGALPGASDGCSDGIVLQPVSDPACTIACGAGFSIGEANVSCPAGATPGQATSGGTCLADCAVPVVTGASVTGCTEGGAATSGGSCTWAPEDGYPCTNTGVRSCSDGTFDLPVSCTENSCAAYGFPPGALEGASDGCSNGIVLQPVSDPACTIACAAGFTLTSATVNCPPDATQGQATTGGTCAENNCAAYNFPPGALPGASDACSDGIVLQPVSDPGCTIACGAGFSAGDLNVSCPAGATPGQATSGGTCLADCAVPTVTGASVTGCSEGGTTASSTACTWAAEPDFVCSDTGVQLCTEGSFPATPSCSAVSTSLPVLPPWGIAVAALGLLAAATRLRARVRARRS
ncbi:MAG: hypothetical protein VX614_05790, partial [Myxococcota bacterium]|nr:hypothetical protein [Myxococcota bacterium]